MKRQLAVLIALVVCVVTPCRAEDESAEIRRFLTDYDAAFNSRSIDRMAVFYHPDVTIFEGGGVNNGWADYRDHHLGPELAEFLKVSFAHTNVVVPVSY